MATKKYSLDKGFLITYNQMLPMLEEMERDGAYEDIGRLIMDSIRRQRSKISYPKTDDRYVRLAQRAFEGVIVARLQGQKGGEATKGNK